MYWRIKRLVRRIIGDPPVLLEEMPLAPGLFNYYRALIATGHKRVKGGWEYDGKFYPDYLTVGGAIFGIVRTAKKYCSGTGVDIGASAWPFPGAVPIDPSYGPGATTISDIPPNSQDYVFSSHTLEHIADWQSALKEWISKVRPGGLLFIYLPHPDCGLWRKENPFMARHHAWVPTPQIVKEAITGSGCMIIDFDDGPDMMQSFFVCAKKDS
jgi:SAM-dependent methyltransferase